MTANELLMGKVSEKDVATKDMVSYEFNWTGYLTGENLEGMICRDDSTRDPYVMCGVVESEKMGMRTFFADLRIKNHDRMWKWLVQSNKAKEDEETGYWMAQLKMAQGGEKVESITIFKKNETREPMTREQLKTFLEQIDVGVFADVGGRGITIRIGNYNVYYFDVRERRLFKSLR